MQVSRIIPILLNIIHSGQQNQKQTSRQVQVDKTAQLYRSLVSAGSTATAGESSVSRPGVTDTVEPLLLPLPLKTPLFPETQFYVFQKPDGSTLPPRHGSGESGIAFSLSTTNLGRLFFMITQHDDALRINCHTENKEIAAQLANHSQQLEQEIEELGFAPVVFRLEVLEPKASPNQMDFTHSSLLDRKI